MKIKTGQLTKIWCCPVGCAHLGSNQGPKDYESSVLLFFIAVCQVVMAITLFVAKLLLNKVADSIISYSNIRKFCQSAYSLCYFLCQIFAILPRIK